VETLSSHSAPHLRYPARTSKYQPAQKPEIWLTYPLQMAVYDWYSSRESVGRLRKSKKFLLKRIASQWGLNLSSKSAKGIQDLKRELG